MCFWEMIFLNCVWFQQSNKVKGKPLGMWNQPKTGDQDVSRVPGCWFIPAQLVATQAIFQQMRKRMNCVIFSVLLGSYLRQPDLVQLLYWWLCNCRDRFCQQKYIEYMYLYFYMHIYIYCMYIFVYIYIFIYVCKYIYIYIVYTLYI